MEKPEYRGAQASVRRGALLTVSTAMFSQSKEKGHKRGALSRGSVWQLGSLQEHDLANLKTAASAYPPCMGVSLLHLSTRQRNLA